VSRDGLEGLVAAARALPQPPEVDAVVAPPRGADRRRKPADHLGLPPHVLRRGVHMVLVELARRTDEALPTTLRHAETAWDQVDAMRILDAALTREARALGAAARLLEADDDHERRALGLEARLTLDAALDLVSLLERRLATLVRLRLRDDRDAGLLVDGKPFLDLGAALHETARRWQ
jgi:hypothetical protein